MLRKNSGYRSHRAACFRPTDGEMMEVKSKVDREVDGNVSGCADMEGI